MIADGQKPLKKFEFLNKFKIPSSTKNLSCPPIHFQFLRFIYFLESRDDALQTNEEIFSKTCFKVFNKNYRLKVFYGIKKNSTIY